MHHGASDIRLADLDWQRLFMRIMSRAALPHTHACNFLTSLLPIPKNEPNSTDDQRKHCQPNSTSLSTRQPSTQHNLHDSIHPTPPPHQTGTGLMAAGCGGASSVETSNGSEMDRVWSDRGREEATLDMDDVEDARECILGRARSGDGERERPP